MQTGSVAADVVLIHEKDLLAAKDKVVIAAREFVRIGHEGEYISGDLQKAGRALVEALAAHDRLLKTQKGV